MIFKEKLNASSKMILATYWSGLFIINYLKGCIFVPSLCPIIHNLHRYFKYLLSNSSVNKAAEYHKQYSRQYSKPNYIINPKIYEEWTKYISSFFHHVFKKVHTSFRIIWISFVFKWQPVSCTLVTQHVSKCIKLFQ